MVKGGFKKYAAKLKTTWKARKGAKKGRVYKSKSGMKTSSNFPKRKFGLVKTVESIVRSMGPPRNVSSYVKGNVTVASGINALQQSMLLISLTAQSSADFAIVPPAPNSASTSFVGVFPNSTDPTFLGSIGISSATTNEYYMKKMKTRLILTPKMFDANMARTFAPIQGFRVIHFAQRRDIENRGNTANGTTGLFTGWGQVAANQLAVYGGPTLYTQLINPQFFTVFKVLSDKMHKVYGGNAFDGTSAAAYPATGSALNQAGALPAAVVSNQTNVIIDFNTYINRKLVNQTVNGATKTVASGDYPQNFPPESKTYVLILPMVSVETSEP